MIRPVLAVALALWTCTATPAAAGVTIPSSTIDEIAIRQSAGMESAFFGPALPGARYGNSVTAQGAIGGYGYEGILGSLSATWNTSRIVPWDAGLSFGLLDLDVQTWTIALSSGTELWSSGRSSIVGEAVVGFQSFIEDSGNYTAFEFGNPDIGTDEDVIVDSFYLLHGMAHAIYSIDLTYLTPMVELGLVGTGYRMNGNVWDQSFPVTQGESREESGAVANVTFGLGVSLNLAPAILFGGMKLTADAALFQANVGFGF